MTQKDKNKIVDQIVELLCVLTAESEDIQKESVELLTVKECTETVKGLSERSVRQLIAQNKIAHIKVGKGNGSKILVSKESLLKYLNGA